MKHLIIAKLDRLGRNVKDALGVVEFLSERGITLHITVSATKASALGHMGKLILTVLLPVAF